METEKYDVVIIGAGPIGLACGIEAQKAGLTYVIIEKGCLVNSIYHYPSNMTFFSTSDKLEIGDVPFISHQPKPNRQEALEYYRRVCSSWKLHVRLYEKVTKINPNEHGHQIITEKTTYQAKSLVLALGFYDRPFLLNIPRRSICRCWRAWATSPSPAAPRTRSRRRGWSRRTSTWANGGPRVDEGRRAVMVTDTQSAPSSTFGASGLDPLWLLTDGAVLHGSKKDPCLAGWRASGTRAGFVAVIGANLDQAFLIRQQSGVRPHKTSGTTRWQQYLEARPMTCRYQPDLAVPYDVTARAQQRMSDDQP